MRVETTNNLGGVHTADLGVVHFIGIGGIGMNAVARLFLARGITVQGSDLREWPPVAALRALGADIQIGHDASHIEGADTVVYSTAVPHDNPELLAARERGLRVLHRSEALVTAMTDHSVVAVSGTNGKTSTTSMIATLLQRAGRDPSFVIGGELSDGGVSAHNGSGSEFVIEADESDSTFLLYSPQIAVVTNIEADHLDTYGTLDGVQRAFEEFVDRIPSGGVLIACADDPGCRKLVTYARQKGVRVRTYGYSDAAGLRVSEYHSINDGARFTVRESDHSVSHSVRLRVPGKHMALNSVAALLAATECGVSLSDAVHALEQYEGVRRRFELKGMHAGVRVYDDYSYHPTSMRVQLETVREVVENGRIIVVFQPYRLYRTNVFLTEIAEALDLADEVIVMEVYSPGEERGPGEGGFALANALTLDREKVMFEPSWSAVPREVARRSSPGDLVLTMGAPPVAMMGSEILDALQEDE